MEGVVDTFLCSVMVACPFAAAGIVWHLCSRSGPVDDLTIPAGVHFLADDDGVRCGTHVPDDAIIEKTTSEWRYVTCRDCQQLLMLDEQMRSCAGRMP
jgi:hypothetical protein